MEALPLCLQVLTSFNYKKRNFSVANLGFIGKILKCWNVWRYCEIEIELGLYLGVNNVKIDVRTY